MFAALKSEFRKLKTVRATYLILATAGVLETLFAFYGDGIKSSPEALKNPHLLAGEVINAMPVVSVLLALVAVLLVANEYRHNTISYTLTATNKWLRVVVAKVIVMSLFVAVFSVALGLLSPLLAQTGLHLAGHHYVAQSFPVWSIVWHAAFYAWGFTILGMVFALIIRNQIGAIVTLFILPTMVEPLLGQIFKNNTQYLPFTALQTVLDPSTTSLKPAAIPSTAHEMVVAGIYMVVGLIVATVLFLRRDAS